jgi:aldose 1-epimerase
MQKLISLVLVAAVVMSIPAMCQAQGRATIQKQPFGKTADGTAVDQFTLTNKNGMVVKIITYGGIITETHVPDRDGQRADVMLGHSTLEGYLAGHPYFGCLTGRVANRIAKGKFTLNGKEYTLAVNNGPNSLHGGKEGFDKKVWQFLSEVSGPDYLGIKLRYVSKDGEEGYPGTLDTIVTYSLTDADEIKIEYVATTDQPTPVNLTNHAYFNLTGGKEDISGHELMLNCDKFTPTDETLIPTGELKAVTGTPLDFTKMTAIGARIKELYAGPGKGYDHNLVLRTDPAAKVANEKLEQTRMALTELGTRLGKNHPDYKAAEQILAALEQRLGQQGGPMLKLCAKVREPKSGRTMEMYTSEPGVQFYSGNFLDGKDKGKGGVVYQKHWGFCLEAQHFPDSVNKSSFPTTILKPGDTYRQTTVYKFGVER